MAQGPPKKLSHGDLTWCMRSPEQPCTSLIRSRHRFTCFSNFLLLLFLVLVFWLPVHCVLAVLSCRRVSHLNMCNVDYILIGQTLPMKNVVEFVERDGPEKEGNSRNEARNT